MALVTKLIGFDIRFLTADFLRARWSAAIRERFLLTTSADPPLSVDRTAWPSRFRLELAGPRPGTSGRGDIAVALSGEPCFDPGTELWVDFDEMLSYRRPARRSHDYGISVAVTFRDHAELTESEWWPGIDSAGVTPAEPAREWGVLGFDVADGSLTSALFNFEVEAAEREALRANWAHRLNPYGLFGTSEDSFAFRDFCNTRFPSHQPFYVYKLLLVWGNLEDPLP
jgi:hypothetical protein